MGSVAFGPRGWVYCGANKGAVDVLTRSLATEPGPRKILVNAVLPGAVETEGARSLAEFDRIFAQFLPRTLLGRIGQPHDIARVVAFPASEDVGWNTGQVIPVAGGLG
jgi:3-oxoacyl-[acyl-carrier protein] reductase